MGPLAGLPVLLTDGEARSTLAAARSLVRAGCEVHVAGRTRHTLAGVSRGVHPWVLPFDPLREHQAYGLAIIALVERIGARVLIPTTDASVEACLDQREALPASCHFPFPATERWRAAADKARLLTLANVTGFGVPHSLTLMRRGERPAAEGLAFPAVVKPHRSVVGANGKGALKFVVTRVPDLPRCVEVLDALPEEAYPVLLQERVQGPGEGIFLLRWQGRIIAHFAHRRLREHPPAGGVSVYREAIAPDPDLLAAATRLLTALDWEGVAMIEGKRDLRTGEWSLMEINGRFWGSLQLAIDAGVDFPALLVAAALGHLLPPHPPEYRTGVRSRWWWGDLDHLALRLLRSRERLDLDETAPGRWRAARDFFQWRWGSDRAEIERFGDPAPFIWESWRRLTRSG
jgi:predicted ATP-grasp superfamily ATP-dependent carboligase